MKHGYSGDQLQVFKKANIFYIRKIYKNKARAQISIFKQSSFTRITSGNYQMTAVPILGYLNIDDKIGIEMPYISGEAGSDLMLSGYIDVPKSLKELLGMYLSSILDKSDIKTMDAKPGLKKIEHIKSTTPLVWHKYLDKGKEFFIKEINKKDVPYPSGVCHGDLTLSNILYKNGCFYLIDFIPSTYESVLSDIVKLEQDLTFGWSSRNCAREVACDLALFSRSATPEVINLIKSHNRMAFDAIEILNWLRIIPYIIDEKTEKFVTKTLDQIFSSK